MVAAPSVLEAVDGAPWWVKLVVALGALIAPVIVQRAWPERGTRRGSPAAGEQAPEPDDEEDLRELRDLLVTYLQRAEKAERELALAKANAQQLQTIVDALIARREAPTPPKGLPHPGP